MNTETLLTATTDFHSDETERRRWLRGILSQGLLLAQNLVYAGTGGVSRNNRRAGFVPGYLDRNSGATVISRFADGRPAPIHVLDGLPEVWVLRRNGEGAVVEVRPGVVAGFIRGGRFYTREQAARALNH